MDLYFSPEDDAFRDEVRTWLHENVPRGIVPDDGKAMRDFDLAWQRTQWDGGWAGISWPTEYQGRGLGLIQQLIWYEELARADAPDARSAFVGIAHGGPTLIARANEEIKSFHLPKILRGEVVWCQGFSEPESGSDLASLRTKGVIDGDQLVVTGQKTWTSYADVADYQELLVRTNPDVPKHKGITWVVCDMRSPGIEVRRIKTMARDHHLNEVFYDEVRIPLTNVVGDIDEGWSVAMSTLGFERGTAFTARQVKLSKSVERLIELAAGRRSFNGKAMIEDDEIARRLGRARAGVASMRAMTYAGISRNATRPPGPEGSMLKLYYSELIKVVAQLSLDILGPDALRFLPDGDPDGWTGSYMRSFASSIGGGTSEILRNIIGDRVLGLPR